MSALICGLFLQAWSVPVYADGGAVRFSEDKQGYRITVFTAPTPFRAGPVDLSVLVQDAATGEPLSQTRVSFRMNKPSRAPLEYPATAEAATNKLLRAAQFELPEPGRWEMEVQVEGLHGTAVIGCGLEAAERLPRWLELWPWITWTALPIALFGLHQLLARRGRYERA